MHDFEIKEMIRSTKIFEKTYDVVRIVDPVLKKALNLKNNEVIESDSTCFDFWNKNQFCDNCISMRAYHENNVFVKIEYKSDKIFIVTAIPYELSNRKIVIELLKDATNSLVFDEYDGQGDNKSEIFEFINHINELSMLQKNSKNNTSSDSNLKI